MKMTPQEAIDRLESMQAQIVHGSSTFEDIAGVIRRLVVYKDSMHQLAKEAAKSERKVKAALPMVEFLERLSETEVHGQPTSLALEAIGLLAAWKETQ